MVRLNREPGEDKGLRLMNPSPGEVIIRVPDVDPTLVRYLQFSYPDALPTGYTWDEREIARKQGQQDIIRHLIELLKEQEAG